MGGYLTVVNLGSDDVVCNYIYVDNPGPMEFEAEELAETVPRQDRPLELIQTKGYKLEAQGSMTRDRRIMATYLAAAWKEFKKRRADYDNFWVYVDSEIKLNAESALVRWNPELFKNTPEEYRGKVINWFKKGVKYVKEEDARRRYRVEFREGGIYRTRDQEPLDTEKTIASYVRQGKPVQHVIWVMHDLTFYSNVCKVGAFQHSSFFAGQAVHSAGQWGVENGKLKWISGESGHYRPDFEFLAQAVRAIPGWVWAQDGHVRVFGGYDQVPHRIEKDKFLVEARYHRLGAYVPAPYDRT